MKTLTLMFHHLEIQNSLSNMMGVKSASRTWTWDEGEWGVMLKSERGALTFRQRENCSLPSPRVKLRD